MSEPRESRTGPFVLPPLKLPPRPSPRTTSPPNGTFRETGRSTKRESTVRVDKRSGLAYTPMAATTERSVLENMLKCPEKISTGILPGSRSPMKEYPKEIEPVSPRRKDSEDGYRTLRTSRRHSSIVDNYISEALTESLKFPHMPLEWFDDEYLYEMHTPQEWVDLGPKRGFRSTNARSRFHGDDDSVEWLPCEVLDYSATDKKYFIRWEKETETRREKWVTRLNIIFGDENEEVFERRIAAAQELRRKVIQDARYAKFLSEEQVPNLLLLPEEDLASIIASIKAGVTLPGPASTTARRASTVPGETERMQMTPRDMILLQPLRYMEGSLGYGNTAKSLTAEGVAASVRESWDKGLKQAVIEWDLDHREEMHVRFTALDLERPTVSESTREYDQIYLSQGFHSAFGKIVTGIENYQECHDAISSKLVMIRPPYVSVLRDMWFTVVNDTSKFPFVHVPDERSHPSSLQSFLEVQEDQREITTERISDLWAPIVADFMEHSDMHVQAISEKQYETSPVKTFLKLIEIMLTNRLWDALFESTDAYVSLLRRYANPLGSEGSSVLITLNTLTPQEIINRTPGQYLPLFHMQIVVNNNAICLSPSMEEVESGVTAVLGQMLELVSHVRRVDAHLFSWIIAPNDTFSLPTLDHPHFQTASDEIRTIMLDNRIAMQHLLAVYQPFESLLSLDIVRYAKAFTDKRPNLTIYETELKRCEREIQKIQNCSPLEVYADMYLVDCAPIKQILTDILQQMCNSLLLFLVTKVRADNEDITAQCAEIERRALLRPTSVEDLVAQRQYVNECVAQVAELTNRVLAIQNTMELVTNHQYQVSDEDTALLWSTFGEPYRMPPILELARKQLAEDTVTIEANLRKQESDWIIHVSVQSEQVKALAKLYDLADATVNSQIVTDLQEALRLAFEEGQLVNSREALLKWDLTNTNGLRVVSNQFEPYFMLWTCAATFKQKQLCWMDNMLNTLDYDVIESSMMNWAGAMQKLLRSFASQPVQLSIVETLKKDIEDFRTHLPLIQALRTPGLRQQHWDEIEKAVGKILVPSKLKLRQCLEDGFESQIVKIQEIAEVAAQEHALETGLSKMRDEWKRVEFEMAPFRDTGTHALRAVDDIQTLLDDQISKTQTMKCSPHVAFIETRLSEWEKTLMNMQHIMQNWLRCQGMYMYLQPIFGSPDIMAQMPHEGQTFQAVDVMWRALMKNLLTNANVLHNCGAKGLPLRLNKAVTDLEHILSKVNDYLEVKRKAFPRFFFLSNDELLEILYETKDPLRVQPHLHKCFEGIASLVFTEDVTITHIVSDSGEQVLLNDVIRPLDFGNRIEKWMLEIEKSMRATLASLVNQSLSDYHPYHRTEWLRRWPGQVVQCVNKIIWTRECIKALKSGKHDLEQLEQEIGKRLADIVALIRSEVPDTLRLTLEALVVEEVQARDATAELVTEKVDNVEDFAWTAQMRYYWEEERVIVRMMTATLNYQYEYLGNTSRLVCTPLTMRVFRTLVTALQLNYGGAPEGPAGTGKTETVKDLAKAVATHCIVFNCSDGLDYTAMARFFKGLATSGAWACFDEFNRLQLEVMSVIAQQILVIARAIGENSRTFVFEGSNLPLNPHTAVFITMNPGYAGRALLPDNLKALFRPVAMMVPNYAMIAEISLYSYGFLDARSLAKKIVTAYALCAQQLSAQDHYDYGMRAVKAVILAAGAHKRKFPLESETILVYRSFVDVNLPKFLAADVELFNGIMSDLFPATIYPSIDYTRLHDAMTKYCAAHKLQPTKSMLTKAVQLYESIKVRHGNMIVGGGNAGKTTTYQALAGALTMLHEEGGPEAKTHTIVINPRSITTNQLYGNFDAVTRDWQDGVLAYFFRNAANDVSGDHTWIVFDGPVDALWIENMNTVLDDNKKLCLVSGEIVVMKHTMNLLFEVLNLAGASPATVSRCGMVYMEPDNLGWQPLLQSWMEQIDPALSEEDFDMLATLFEWLIPPALSAAHLYCRTDMKDIHMVTNTMRLLDSQIDHLKDAENLSTMDPALISMHIQCLFLFSLVWSFGALSGDIEYRTKFEAHLRRIVVTGSPSDDIARVMKLNHCGRIYDEAPFAFKQFFPDGASIYDFVFNPRTNSWDSWQQPSDFEFEIPPNSSITETVVPTKPLKQYSYLVSALLSHRYPVVLNGGPGCGKSLYFKVVLQNLTSGLTPKYMAISLNFSARTTPRQVQASIEAKMERRKNAVEKGAVGPPVGMTCVVFVDDINLPEMESYGAQPPIELLRQLQDHNGWYDHKEASLFRRIEDTVIGGCISQRQQSTDRVSERFMRHFNVICPSDLDDASLQMTISATLRWFLAPFPDNVEHGISRQMIDATISIYHKVQAHLRPTPTKLHYIFTMKDIQRLFMGMLLAHPSTITTREAMVRLWCHEVLRVFHDRLVDDTDRSWVKQLVKDLTEEHFEIDFTATFLHLDLDGNGDIDEEELRHLIFTDFDRDTRYYKEVMDLVDVVPLVETFLEGYNALSQKPMKLVLFLFAVEHVARIARVLRQPEGNALLVGVGGSGRQSLTRLAAHICEYELMQVEIMKGYGVPEWRDDMKKLMRRTGQEGKQTVFLLTDTQIKDETFLEDINTLLSAGDIPMLWSSEEVLSIIEAVRPAARLVGKNRTSAQVYSYFLERARRNTHIVFCMSPVGDLFRKRLLMFPALISCCTIDWFAEWPEEALEGLAQNFISEAHQSVDEDMLKNIVGLCMHMHRSVVGLSERFYNEERRHNYVTPAQYLDLITLYNKLLEDKQAQLSTTRRQYERGLEKLALAQEQVQKMQEELNVMQPQLKITSMKTKQLLHQIKREAAEAVETKNAVKIDEEKAKVEAAVTQQLKDDCERDLRRALPALQHAVEALSKLRKEDIGEVKVMKSPPQGVKLVMEAVCVMTGVEPVKVKEKHMSGTITVLDYWEASKKHLLNDPKFLQRLLKFDKDSIPPEVLKQIEKYIDDPAFVPALIKRASRAAMGLCEWIRAIAEYHKVKEEVAPKQAALTAAQDELEASNALLREKQKQVEEIEAKIDELKAKYNAQMDIERDLKERMYMCETKLQRANLLIEMFSEEQERWRATAAELTGQLHRLWGDCLLAAGTIAYLGAFTATFRQQIVAEWIEKCVEMNIPCSDNYSFIDLLGDAIESRMWVNQQRLPSDSFSMENALIMKHSRRWPLVIDPQDQCNTWIKNKEHNLQQLKLNTSDFLRSLETAIQWGSPVLLEDVPEELDPSLEPILQKQVFRHQGRNHIRLGDHTIPYDDNFKLCITSKASNPHFLPQLTTKVTLVNFTITPLGLREQLLGIVLDRERGDLEKAKQDLIRQNDENSKKLHEVEEQILKILDEAQNILEDETAIEIVKSSKELSVEIKRRQQESAEKEALIDAARDEYLPFVMRATNLFFGVTYLATLSPMYQYSLTWFTSLFVSCIETSKKGNSLDQRLEILSNDFTFLLYKQVCRSLFERHQLLFSFLLCLATLQGTAREPDPAYLRFLVTGGSTAADEVLPPNPCPSWLPANEWVALCHLAKVPGFEGVEEHLTRAPEVWQQWYEDNSPHTSPFPLDNPPAEMTTPLQRLMFLRCMRKDKLSKAVMEFVSKTMKSDKYTYAPASDLLAVHKDSTCRTPIILLLSPGSDPTDSLFAFAASQKFANKIVGVSLGQGQYENATQLIKRGVQQGLWVVLQNVHLAQSWLESFANLYESDVLRNENIHADFRLWLTTYPTASFPTTVLQNGIKMTTEPPKGLRANMLSSFQSNPLNNEKWFNDTKYPREFQRVMFTLCFFHAQVQERRKFGPLGFNVPYQFSQGDLLTSLKQLKMLLTSGEGLIRWDTLLYLVGEVNYGGRITDDADRRTIQNLLRNLLSESVLDDVHSLVPDAREASLFIPPQQVGKVDIFTKDIGAYPVQCSPEVFGLHDNATITKDLNETSEFLSQLLVTQSSSAIISADLQNAIVADVCSNIIAKLPAAFDITAVRAKYQVSYSEALNVVLAQELQRFNKLLRTVRSSVNQLQRAIEGVEVMSPAMQDIANSMYDGRVPQRWLNVSYPSLKPLASYVEDFVQRLAFFHRWVEDGIPAVFWISSFFFTQSFLSAVQNNFARKYSVPIDTITFNFSVMDANGPPALQGPPDGVYVRGLFLEGASWDRRRKTLDESSPKVLFEAMPPIWFLPVVKKPEAIKETRERERSEHTLRAGSRFSSTPSTPATPSGALSSYACPLYKTTERAGTLTTTGLSSNFVTYVQLPTRTPALHWIKRGVALVSQLDD